MNAIKAQINDRFSFEYGALFKEYGWTMTKLQVAWYLGVTERKFHDDIKDGRCPKFYRTGDGKRSELRFKIYDVAEYGLSL